MDSTCGIGLVGWGTVGGGVIDILSTQADLIAQRCGIRPEIRRVVTRHPERSRSQHLSAAPVSADINDIINDTSIDIVLLLVGGTTIALDMCKACLQAGKHVVTANKAIVAEHWEELFGLARQHNVCLVYEAAVAGGIPIIDVLRNSYVANRIDAVHGILNGTCNYVLTMMEEQGLPYEKAVKQAKDLGYAEADPTLDVNGTDTAHKLVILSRLAFQTALHFDQVPTTGIESISAADIRAATQLGARIRLLGSARRCGDGIRVAVAPHLIPLDHPLAGIRLNYNAVNVEAHAAGKQLLVGQGAGALPTASAVLSDVIALACGSNNCNDPRFTGQALVDLPLRQSGEGDDDSQLSYYIRFTVSDRTGTLARICAELRDRDISVLSIHQEVPADSEHVNIIVLTHPCAPANLRACLNTLEGEGNLTGTTVVMEWLD